jgi:hypothetical protein
VEIQSNPAGARVAVDGSALQGCTTPCELTLGDGRHVLNFSMAGYRIAPRIIQLPGVTNVTVNLDRMAGTLAISSTPAGATIYLNGERRTERTPAMIRLPVGNYRVRLELADRPPYEETVEVGDQRIVTFGVEW